MKRKLLFLALLFVGLVGCTYNTLPDDVATPIVATEQGFDLGFATRAEVFDGQSLDSKYFVAEEDLESFLNYKQQHSDKKIIVKDCTPYGFDGSHTLFYVLNYADGWEVVSADKRTQATLAYGEGKRTFSMGADNTNEAEKLWMNMLASDVLQKRQRSDSTNNKSFNIIKDDLEINNVDWWNCLSQSNSTRSGNTPILGPITPPSGLYRYLVGHVTDTTLVQQINPLIQTRWGQQFPWNTKCPESSEFSYIHVPAGCVAVAGGQVLHYLRNKYNATFFIPQSAIASGNLNNYQISFSNSLSNAIWGAMALTDDEYVAGWTDGPTQLVATLLAWIGNKINMNYGDTVSTASNVRLMENVFESFNISWKHNEGYDYNVITEQLVEKKLPLIVDANVENEHIGHSWIIDGFRKLYYSHTPYYYDSPRFLGHAEVSMLTIEDGQPGEPVTHNYEGFLHMNWGWNDHDTYDDYFYAAPSNWTPDGETSPYNVDVDLYYNFVL